MKTEHLPFAALIDETHQRIDRRLFFTDPDLYQLEQERVFEKTWLFVAHESMIPKDYDYFTTSMGQVPVVIMRTPQGFKALINACAHRGAKLYRLTFGHAKTISCGFHGWTFDADGKLLGMPKEEEGGYPDFFKKALVV